LLRGMDIHLSPGLVISVRAYVTSHFQYRRHSPCLVL